MGRSTQPIVVNLSQLCNMRQLTLRIKVQVNYENIDGFKFGGPVRAFVRKR